MSHQTALTSFSAAFVDEISRSGIRDVVVSPGSRSTPLAMLFYAHPDIHVWINVDERSAGFFALGIAKGKQAPVALLCSSGTAGANYYPAIIEARYARVPLVVLTADRPHELRGVGAPQTIDQVKLYGDHVKWHQDMPLPEYDETLWRFARSSARRAVIKAEQRPKGPVHLNFPFREPLIPDLEQPELWEYGKVNVNSPETYNESLNLKDDHYNNLAEQWQKVQKPLIVVGPEEKPGQFEAVLKLADTLEAPILVDPLSGLRANPLRGYLNDTSDTIRGKKNLQKKDSHRVERIIDGYDAFLRDKTFVNTIQTDGIIRFGAMPVSKPLLKYIEAVTPQKYLVVDEADDWRDPTHLTTDVVRADTDHFCREWSAALSRTGHVKNREWTGLWTQANKTTGHVVEQFMETNDWFEGHVVTTLLSHIRPDSILFAGNSMPIRDLDTFFLKTDQPMRVLANRGANGIDGVISTGLGTSVGPHPTYLLIGDLSFFHDTNGLMAAKQHGLDMTIIVVNNNGGGIFSFLPQAREAADDFEKLFGTPLDVNVEATAKLYDAFYRKVSDVTSFGQALKDSHSTSGLKIIEAVTSRPKNVESHQKLWEQIAVKVKEACAL